MQTWMLAQPQRLSSRLLIPALLSPEPWAQLLLGGEIPRKASGRGSCLQVVRSHSFSERSRWMLSEARAVRGWGRLSRSCRGWKMGCGDPQVVWGTHAFRGDGRSQHTYWLPRMPRVGRATLPSSNDVPLWVPLQRHRSPKPWSFSNLKGEKRLLLITVNARYSQVAYFQVTYSLELVVTPKQILEVLSRSFTDMHRGAKNLSHLVHAFPAEMEQSDNLSSCVGSHIVHTCPL